MVPADKTSSKAREKYWHSFEPSVRSREYKDKLLFRRLNAVIDLEEKAVAFNLKTPFSAQVPSQK